MIEASDNRYAIEVPQEEFLLPNKKDQLLSAFRQWTISVLSINDGNYTGLEYGKAIKFCDSGNQKLSAKALLATWVYLNTHQVVSRVQIFTSLLLDYLHEISEKEQKELLDTQDINTLKGVLAQEELLEEKVARAFFKWIEKFQDSSLEYFRLMDGMEFLFGTSFYRGLSREFTPIKGRLEGVMGKQVKEGLVSLDSTHAFSVLICIVDLIEKGGKAGDFVRNILLLLPEFKIWKHFHYFLKAVEWTGRKCKLHDEFYQEVVLALLNRPETTDLSYFDMSYGTIERLDLKIFHDKISKKELSQEGKLKLALLVIMEELYGGGHLDLLEELCKGLADYRNGEFFYIHFIEMMHDYLLAQGGVGRLNCEERDLISRLAQRIGITTGARLCGWRYIQRVFADRVITNQVAKVIQWWVCFICYAEKMPKEDLRRIDNLERAVYFDLILLMDLSSQQNEQVMKLGVLGPGRILPKLEMSGFFLDRFSHYFEKYMHQPAACNELMALIMSQTILDKKVFDAWFMEKFSNKKAAYESLDSFYLFYFILSMIHHAEGMSTAPVDVYERIMTDLLDRFLKQPKVKDEELMSTCIKSTLQLFRQNQVDPRVLRNIHLLKVFWDFTLSQSKFDSNSNDHSFGLRSVLLKKPIIKKCRLEERKDKSGKTKIFQRSVDVEASEYYRRLLFNTKILRERSYEIIETKSLEMIRSRSSRVDMIKLNLNLYFECYTAEADKLLSKWMSHAAK